jgi:uncharacterized protein YcbK (DUF882 family)
MMTILAFSEISTSTWVCTREIAGMRCSLRYFVTSFRFAVTEINMMPRHWFGSINTCATRTGDIREYDPHLFDLLHDLVASAGHSDAEIVVMCGYRAPRTNEYLRSHGHGVARHSLHMQGMAIDIQVPGVSTS